MPRIAYDSAATQSILAIHHYISQELNAPLAADAIVDKILSAIDLLVEFPESGNLLTNVYDHVHESLKNHRRILVGNYVVTYIFDVQKDVIYIQDIFDRRTDYHKKLKS